MTKHQLTSFARTLFGYAATITFEQRKAFYDALSLPTIDDAAKQVGTIVEQCLELALEHARNEELING